MRKSDGVFFEEWLHAMIDSGKWNGRMRTPDGWQILFDLDYSVEQAATCTKTSLEICRTRAIISS